MTILHLGLLLAGLWAAGALLLQHQQAKAFGPRTLFSKPAGKAGDGVLYAFTKGMSPWAKESVRMNLPAYAAGMAFHAGVFTAFALLVAAVARVELPALVRVPVQVLLAVGALGGVALLVKRSIKPQLRGLSTPDDFVSNLLSSCFVLLALVSTFAPGAVPVWEIEALLLLVYVPLGKIRHCFFFFTTRYHLGAFFGRRGSFPPSGSHHA